MDVFEEGSTWLQVRKKRDVFEEASTWAHLRKMFYNKRMESQPVEMNEVYWCPELNKHLLISGIDYNDGAMYLGQEYDVLEEDIAETPRLLSGGAQFIYYGVEKTELWPISDYQGMREKMKKFLVEINERANASPTEQELFNEVTTREKP